MRHIAPIIIIALTAISCTAEQKAGYPINPVPFTSVKVTDEFWGSRLKASRETTIPLAFSKCEETGRYENFVRATKPDSTYHVGGFPFDDTDVYKTIEGASYILQTYPDEQLEAYIDSVLTLVAAAQEPDGYLNTARQMNPWHPHAWVGPERWSEVEGGSHEFYNLGHMVEGAIAHYQATGKRNFLDIAIKYADCVCREIGHGEDQQVKVPGHEIAEMALAKLYTVTGDRKYLDQAKFFVDRRGTTSIRSAYSQSHVPLMEQDEAVGHAVRAVYFYSGVADVAALTGEQKYIDAIDRIWENIVSKKLYITGGVGARHDGEAFGCNYELPNESAYCETCAAIGFVYFNYRMFLLHGESKYYDALERTLYNGLISGVSVEGDSFFYPNPLECNTVYQRQPWFGCACCPSNICRFIPSIPGYIYATKDDNLYVNLYMSNTMTQEVNGQEVTLSQKTGYPWNGDVTISVDSPSRKPFTLKLRIPGWVRGEVVPSDLYSYDDGKQPGYSVKVNGETVESELEDGYFCISRKWKEGDTVELHMDMEERTVVANEAVEADRGKHAVEKGPIVYCEETVDGVTDTIPYYHWAHRGPSSMKVWL